ncbi:histidine kinase dimerization/phosphoacceptor domain -containing protein [Spirosoma arcticum]
MRRLISIGFLLGQLGSTLFTTTAVAQSTSATKADRLGEVIQLNEPDTYRLKALLTASAFYLSKPLNLNSSLDSALVLARQAEKLSRQLKDAKRAEEAVFLQGKVYVKQQNAATVRRMLAGLSDTIRIRLLLELGKQKLRPTFTQEVNRDSALLWFQQAETLSTAIGNQRWQEESWCLIGVYYLLNGNWPRGQAYFTQVIKARQRVGDKAGEVRAWLRMATTRFCDDCQENIYCLTKALALCHQLGDRPLEAIIRMEIGYKQLSKGDIHEAEREALRAVAIQNVVGFKALNQAYHALANESVYYTPSDYGYLSNAYYFLSDLSQAKGNLNRKLFYILNVVKSVESSGMADELDYTYFRLGNAYWELGQFDKSIEYYRQSLAISHQKGQLFVQIGLPRRMVVALLRQANAREALLLLKSFTHQNLPVTYEDKMFIAQSFGACYNALKQYKRAEKHYLQGVDLSEQSALQFQYIAWKHISQFYVTTAQYTKADPYLKRLLLAAREQIIPSHLIDVHLMRFKVDSALGNYSAAIRHYQQYKTLSDSVFNVTKSKQTAQLSIQYETEKKEQALRLREKDIALLTEQSKSQQAQRNGLVIGTGLLLALLGLSYNRYRLKQRSNQQLQAQQKEINQKNEHLSELLIEKDSLLVQKDTFLKEKEWLLKEIHHRVKNNLQMVMSLLNSQASYLSDELALSAIQETQHRVQAMALIHQKLYQSEGIARIPIMDYVQDVVHYLHDSYNLAQPIRFQLAVEPIELDVAVAVPLGLIINEAITNTFKYAFPEGCAGTVSVRLHRLAQTTYELTIADDGIGLPEGYAPARSRSLGMTLMHGFSEQLGGELHIISPPGLTIRLVFSEELLDPIYLQELVKNVPPQERVGS